jgi:hypothetical protein
MVLAARLHETLSTLGTSVFLTTFDSARRTLAVHVPLGCDVAEVKSRIQREVDEVEDRIQVSVHAHKARDLTFPTSVERWIERFGSGDVLYDPTMIMTRARAMVQTAKLCRSACGDLIGGLFFDPLRREVFVLCQKNRDANLISALHARITEVAKQASAQTGADIRIVSDLPRRKLVPIDGHSASIVRKIMRAARRWRMHSTVAAAMLVGSAVPATAYNIEGDVRLPAGETTAATAGEFGVLRGLSVFEDDAFSSAGLELYFGKVVTRTDALMQLAQAVRRNCRPGESRASGCRDPNEVGQVGPGS